MDMKIILMTLVAAVAIGGAGMFILGHPVQTAQTTAEAPESVQEDDRNIGIGMNEIATAEVTKADSMEASSEAAGTAHTVEMSPSGFSPDSLTIKAGDTVTFLAVDGSNRWPASAFHPTHTAYPGSSIQKCSTDEKNMIFDSCGVVAEGQSWSFTFDEVGEWNYHDHDDSKVFGKIIVE